MKLKILTLLSILIMVSVSAQTVTTDVDKSADFTKFQTYEFLGWQDDSDAILNELDKKRLRDSFKAEFEKRNLKYVEENGDIGILLYLVVSQETSITAYTNYYSNGGYGYCRAGGWYNGHATTSYSENQYLKGTLVMDVLDSETKNLVWQGVASGTIKENPEKRDKSIPKSIKKLMKKFPIQPVK